MRGKIFLILVLIFSAAFVSSLETPITLKVNPNAQVTLNVLDPATIQPYSTFFINSSGDGMAYASFSGDVGLVALSFVVRKSGKVVQYVKASDYGNFSTSSSIYIDTLKEPEETTSVNINDTNNTQVIANETDDINLIETTSQNDSDASLESPDSEQELGISGSVVAGGSNFLGKWKYYLAGGGVLILVVGFLVFRFFMGRSSQPGVNPWKNPFVNNVPKSVPVSNRKLEEQLSESQKRIAELQKEIVLMKNKEKIQEAERKIEEDKKELDKLRKGL